jgi:MFS family permease
VTAAEVVPGDRRAWLVLAAMSLPLAALSIDVSGAGVALPAIGQSFALGAGGKAWVMNGSALAFGASLLFAGALADRLGPRRLLLLGVGGFGLASALCGAAPNAPVLVTARILQGLASSLCFTTSLSVVDSLFVPARRARAIGIWGAVGGVGSALGPLVAGTLSSALSWRWFFAVNVPLCLLALPLLATLLRTGVSAAQPPSAVPPNSVPWSRIGAIGVLFVAISVAAGQARSWAVLLGAGTAAVGAVAVLVRARERRTPPVLGPSVVARSSFRAALAVAFCSNWGFGVTLVMMGEYLEIVRGQSAVRAGVTTLAFSVTFAGAGLATGWLAARGFRRALVVSTAPRHGRSSSAAWWSEVSARDSRSTSPRWCRSTASSPRSRARSPR